LARYQPKRAGRVGGLGVPSTPLTSPSSDPQYGNAPASDGSGLTNNQETTLQANEVNAYADLLSGKQVTYGDYVAICMGATLLAQPELLPVEAGFFAVFGGVVWLLEQIWGTAGSGPGPCATNPNPTPDSPTYVHYSDHNTSAPPANAFEAFVQPVGKITWETQNNCGPAKSFPAFLQAIVDKWNTYHSPSTQVVYDSNTMSIQGQHTEAEVVTALQNFGTGNPGLWPDPLGFGGLWFTPQVAANDWNGHPIPLKTQTLYTVNLGPLTPAGVAASQAGTSSTTAPASSTAATVAKGVAVVAAGGVLATGVYAYATKTTLSAVASKIWSAVTGRL
jgi:hypothetical protein